MSAILRRKIIIKKATICVVGLGYVGLPLAVSFAKAGFRVFGVDLDADRVERIQKRISYITDITSKELAQLVRAKRLSASTDFKVIEDVDVVIICVPTPLKRKYQPNISFILDAVKRAAQFLKGKKLIILESTTYPGTTDEVILPLLESKGLRHAKDFYLVFSPERIDPGNKQYGLTKIPKVIGGVTAEAAGLAQKLYEHITPYTCVVSSARVAEMVKLLENTFRIVNIGLVNELAMMAHKLKIDIWEVIDAAKTKPFGFMPFYPGPGVGGHCIPKDPLYLYWKAKHFGFRSRFIKLAADLNSSMPQYIVERVAEMLKARKKALRKAKILVSGVTYKKDVKDLRKSPALDIIEILRKKGARVSYYDPYIPYLKFNRINLKSVPFGARQLRVFDCVIVATDHSNIDYKALLKNANLIFDARRIYRKTQIKKVVTL